MAEYNAKLHVKTSTGYDDINVATKASIVEFNNSSTGMSSTNVNDAIKELNTEKVNKTDIVNNLVSTNTDKPLSANMGKQLKTEIDNTKNLLSFKPFNDWGNIDVGNYGSGQKRITNEEAKNAKKFLFVFTYTHGDSDSGFEYVEMSTPFGNFTNGFYKANTSEGVVELYYQNSTGIIDLYKVPMIIKQIFYIN